MPLHISYTLHLSFFENISSVKIVKLYVFTQINLYIFLISIVEPNKCRPASLGHVNKVILNEDHSHKQNDNALHHHETQNCTRLPAIAFCKFEATKWLSSLSTLKMTVTSSSEKRQKKRFPTKLISHWEASKALQD